MIEQVKSSGVKDYGTSLGKIVEAGKTNFTDEQLVLLPSDEALKMVVYRSRKPIGASSVDKPPKDVIWVECFTNTKQGKLFLMHDSRFSFHHL